MTVIAGLSPTFCHILFQYVAYTDLTKIWPHSSSF